MLTHHDLQTLGLVAAVQAGPPAPDLALVHEADVVTSPAHLHYYNPLKNPSRRDGGTKPEALVPKSLRVGFLRGV